MQQVVGTDCNTEAADTEAADIEVADTELPDQALAVHTEVEGHKPSVDFQIEVLAASSFLEVRLHTLVPSKQQEEQHDWKHPLLR